MLEEADRREGRSQESSRCDLVRPSLEKIEVAIFLRSLGIATFRASPCAERAPKNAIPGAKAQTAIEHCENGDRAPHITHRIRYRCFLSDLAGLAALRCAGPGRKGSEANTFSCAKGTFERTQARRGVRVNKLRATGGHRWITIRKPAFDAACLYGCRVRVRLAL